ncbi:MAG: IPExxxVDY family protein [Flavobacteriaceae bacterium]|nr:IPExxxVDY family protein [Flavobacteriaceae bacterium]
MPTYSLDISDFSDTPFSLFGIKTPLEDYRLAYFLNKALLTQFKRAESNLEFETNNEKKSFSLFSFEDIYHYTAWFLIANKYKQTKTDHLVENLFTPTNFNFESINYLIPERKSFDYFLKIIGGEKNFNNRAFIQQLKSIHLVEAVFEIAPEELKSKDFLIF